MTDQQKILVVGGGIGGLSAAIAFMQEGYHVDIVEIQKEWNVYGVGIIQPNNALRALDRLGVAHQCVEVGFGFKGWRLTDANGGLIAEVPSHNRAAPDFPPNNGIRRPALHKILTERAKELGAVVHLGCTVAAMEQDADGVDVRLSDGTEHRVSLVVASDGLYSKVRESLFPGKYHPKFSGEAVWRYNLPKPEDMDWGHVIFARQSKAGLVPIGPDLMYLFLVTHEPGNPRFPADQMHHLLRDRLQEYGGLVAELAHHINKAEEVVCRPMEPVFMDGPWHSGRVVLIGDAVHGTTPHLAQGASIAIEDAVVLVEEILGQPDVELALSKYRSRRYDRCKLVYDGSLQLGAWELEEWSGIHNPDANPAKLMSEIWDQMSEEI